MEVSSNILVMIPGEEWNSLKLKVQQVIDQLDQVRLEIAKAQQPQKNSYPGYLTVGGFMEAVHIGRWKFDELVAKNMIRTVKKKRKIYIPMGEVERFFMDSSIR